MCMLAYDLHFGDNQGYFLCNLNSVTSLTSFVTHITHHIAHVTTHTSLSLATMSFILQSSLPAGFGVICLTRM